MKKYKSWNGRRCFLTGKKQQEFPVRYKNEKIAIKIIFSLYNREIRYKNQFFAI
jgi:hypothetical protein